MAFSTLEESGSGGGTVTGADNGLHLQGTDVYLGGTLVEDTTVNQGTSSLFFTDGNLAFGTSPTFGLSLMTYGDATVYNGLLVTAGNTSVGVSDLVSGNEANIQVSLTEAKLRFLDFATDPSFQIGVTAAAFGVGISGNKNDDSLNTIWTGWDGISNVNLARISNRGDWSWYNYPNTRDDSGTFAPTSFLYTDNVGQVLEAPLTLIYATIDSSALWGLDINDNLGDLRSGISLGATLGFVAGPGATLAGLSSIVIGSSATALSDNGIVIGASATGQNGSIAIGVNTNSADNGVVLGNGANTINGDAVALGTLASSNANGIAIGASSTANINGIALGSGATNTMDGEFIISSTITQLNFPLNAHSAGAVLQSDGSGIATWFNGADATVVIPLVGTLTFQSGLLTSFV